MKFLWIIIFILGSCGCASLGQRWKAFVNGNNDKPTQQTANDDDVTFNQQKTLEPPVKRQYRRVTRQSLEDESGLDDHSGSLWTMEGQGAYLFAQNTIRLIGDPIPVSLEGDPRSQLETKVGVIKKLMARLEARQREAQERDLASESSPSPTAAPEAEATTTAVKGKPSDKAKSGDEKADFKVNIIPSRITERMIDGNYRIKGSQPMMIGNRDYRVIVTGIVRAEDFSEDGVSATKLLDPKFDVVSARQKDDFL